jgi:hypothetical protein
LGKYTDECANGVEGLKELYRFVSITLGTAQMPGKGRDRIRMKNLIGGFGAYATEMPLGAAQWNPRRL